MVTAGEKHLLEFIGSKEAPQGYGTVYGNKQARLNKPLVAWTVREIVSANPTFTKRFGSSACGRYQFMRDTLKGLIAETPAIADQKFTPALQDELGARLLRRRGYTRFANRQITIPAFGKALAQEWASFPVLTNTQGAHRAVKRGDTYYSGDGLNKALISPAEVERCLRECLKIEAADPVEVAEAEPVEATASVAAFAPSLAGIHPVAVSQQDPDLIAPAKPLSGLWSLLQGKPPVARGERTEVVAQAKEEAPSLMKDLGAVKTLGLLGGAGSLLGGFQDSGLLDSVKASADGATSTFESVQTLVNLVLGAIKWGVTHWWVFGLILSLYVLFRIGWAIFKVYVYVKNGVRPNGE